MMYIQKQKTSSEVSNEINRVKRDVKWKQINSTDTVAVRSAFDMLEKSILRKHLLSEQKGLCAYCMRRIRDDEKTVIEHWIPLTTDGAIALDYNNMMACCDGGRTIDALPKVICCDAAKENHVITLNPYNKDQMDRIRYRSDGRIYIHPFDETLLRDINDVLRLNGEVDHNGKTIDTATKLVYGRRQVYKLFETYIKQLEKKGKPVGTCVKQKIEEILSANEYIEYAGVWLYFLKRKLKSISNT